MDRSRAELKWTNSIGYRMFRIVNTTFLIILMLLCLMPLLNVLAISLSGIGPVSAGKVSFIPRDFNIISYIHILTKPEFPRAFRISFYRIGIGLPLSMLLTVLAAYPLSLPPENFKARKYYVWIFVIPMLFSGGLIPWYLTINALGIIDSIWALVLPYVMHTYHVVLMLNFFRQLPKEMGEAAYMDGAGHFLCLTKVYLPNSLPSLATITLFTVVFLWNEWFGGMLLMNKVEHYPLQSFLRMIIREKIDIQHLSSRQLEELSKINDRTYVAAQIFVATIPIIIIYPFLQRYFVKGFTIGSVKG